MKLANLVAMAVLAAATSGAFAEGPVNYPDNLPKEDSAVMVQKTRAQVKAELAEARRLGLIVYGELGTPVTTPEQEKLIAEAGRRVVEHQLASK